MISPQDFKNQRQALRVSSDLPIRISIGSQLSFSGHLKDLSLKSAFIKVSGSIFVQSGDEITFIINSSTNNVLDLIKGFARISRIVPGEGFAVFFIKMDENSQNRLKKLVYGLK